MQPRLAGAAIARHSSIVGSRQSPGEDPSDRPQSPVANCAAAWLASNQGRAWPKHDVSFSQIRPVARSVTVPLPQSSYRFRSSTKQGPSARGAAAP